MVGNEDIMRWQQRLAKEEGLYIEPASAGGLAAIEKFRSDGEIAENDKVVTLLTASGLKDPAATAAVQGDLQMIPGDLNAAIAIFREMKLITN